MKSGASKRFVPWLVLACVLAVPLPVSAQVGQVGMTPPLHVDVVPTVDRYPAGGSYPLLLHVTVDEPWHVNSDRPLEEYLIPTTVAMDVPEGVSAGRTAFPEAHRRKFDFSDTELSIFEREFYILTSIAVSAGLPPGDLTLRGAVEYQACNDASCLPPQRAAFEAVLNVVEAGAPVEHVNGEVLAAAEAARARPETTAGAAAAGAGAPAGGFGSSGLLVTILLVYLGGLALNLTPCVYPLIPITVGYFGGQSEGRKGGLLVHAIVYVLGMSVTYSALGVFASLTGSMLGQALQNPVVLIFIALVMVALALSMFGLYEIQVPQSIAQGASQTKSGYFGTAFMGLTVGFIAAPCIGPFVLGLMTWVGEKGDPLLGFLMFFVLAIGLGTPFLFLALFSGAINDLPRSGDWMVWVRKVFGVVLLGMAVYFLAPLMPDGMLRWIVLPLAVASGIYLGFLETSGRGRAGFLWIKRAIGVLVILAGVYFVMPSETAGPGLAWVPYREAAAGGALDSGRAVMIDFSADWCIPCKELEHYTFSDPRVVARSAGMMLVKADLTSFDSPESVALRDQFGIKGVPTVVFLDAGGRERADLRFVGFIEANALLAKLDALGVPAAAAP